MPRERISREMIEEAAFALAREGGMERVLVKEVAARLNCSVQPVYSQFENMEALRRAVEARTGAFVREFVRARLDPSQPFRSTGYAYVALAREEPPLFRIFVMQRREGVDSMESLYRREASAGMAECIARELGVSRARAAELHLNMLIYTMGLGVVYCSASPGMPPEELGARLEGAYEAFLKRAKGE